MVIPGSSALLSRLNYTKNVLKSGNNAVKVLSSSFINLRLHTVDNAESHRDTTSSKNQNSEAGVQTEKVSKAMRAYLERATKHDEFMRKETVEFNIGKRHLANMMGENVDTMTQADIDQSIEYLFPSGIYDPRARPIMRPPSEVFPQRKAAEFDKSGRPFHSMFYTSKPNYYQLLYDIVDATNKLKAQKIAARNSNVQPDPANELNVIASMLISKDELERSLMEQIIDKDYNEFVQAMEKLLQYPGLLQFKDLIMKYRKPLMNQKALSIIPKIEYNTEGRPFITTTNCMRKSARGEVTVWGHGSGKITINGESILYFKDVQAREQIIFPLIFTGLSNSVDVDATVTGGGESGQAGAIRWGISWSLRSFVDPETVEKMRIAGLLKRDPRTRERKKPGQAGARKKFTWKKR